MRPSTDNYSRGQAPCQKPDIISFITAQVSLCLHSDTDKPSVTVTIAGRCGWYGHCDYIPHSTGLLFRKCHFTDLQVRDVAPAPVFRKGSGVWCFDSVHQLFDTNVSAPRTSENSKQWSTKLQIEGFVRLGVFRLQIMYHNSACLLRHVCQRHILERT